MKPTVEKQRDIILRTIDQSKNIDANDKLFLTQILSMAAEHTNGETQEQKIQGLAETTFLMANLLITHILDAKEPNNKQTKLKLLLSAFEKCQWAIVSLGGILAALLAYRPEISEIIKSFAN